jgi:hypothetical protein
MGTNKILIITSVFPPNPGIGGRRWAKFAKTLSNIGYEVHIIKPVNFSNDKSLWNKDVLNPTIHIHSFNLFFQRIANSTSNNLLIKVIRKIFYLLFKRTKYYFTDTSSLSISRIKKIARTVIEKEKISTVIISANPNYYYVGYLLKLEYKDAINIVLDYRDLWNDHSYYELFFKRTQRQIKYSNKLENLALNHCDYLITVDDYILSVIEKRIYNDKLKKVVIPNGFDKDDYSDLMPSGYNAINTRIDKIKLFFAGSIDGDVAQIAEKFINEFVKLRDENRVLFQRFELTIYCNSNSRFINKYKDIGYSNMIIKNLNLSISDYVKMISESDYGLLFTSREYSNSFFTKFYDYIYLQKRIINIGYQKAGLADFLVKNRIGINFIENDIKSFFKDLEEDYLQNNQYMSRDKINEFDILFLTNKIIDIIESQMPQDNFAFLN